MTGVGIAFTKLPALNLAVFVLSAGVLVPSFALSESSSSFFASELSDSELVHELLTAEPRQFKPVGHTSVVFRMRLEGPATAAYKVASHSFPRVHLAEVAAYRVASLLGLDNVPPAALRRVARDKIDARMHPDYSQRWRALQGEVRWLEGGIAEGAASVWVFGLRSLRLEREQTRWRAWLRGNMEIPKERLALARDLSNMVVFDYLIGNRDRFSGSNMKVLPGAGRLVLLDNDQAFPTAPSDASHSDFLLESLKLTERFSRSAVKHLLALEESDLRAELGASPRPLLTHNQINGLMERRAILLSYVARLIEERGRDAVLYFD